MFYLRNIHFSLTNGRPLFNGFDLETKHTRTGIIGAQGVGKTTLLHIMLGFYQPHMGEVFAFGKQRIHEEDFIEVRRRTGFLFQDANDQLFCPTVIEDVAFGPRNLGWRKSSAYEAAYASLLRLNIQSLCDEPIHRLSWDQKRLTAFAGILACEPEVLLLDEPLVGVDVEIEQKIIQILYELPQSILIVARDEKFVTQFTPAPLRLHHGTLTPYSLDT